MTNFIPIFPLGVILYPQEKMHLHIFEPRYKQLITECYGLQKPFGIPVILNDRLQDMGALAEVTEIVKTYETGEMDINIRAIKIFRILELIKAVPDKLYSGAIVHYPDNKENDGRPKLVDAIMKGIKEVHRLLNIHKDFGKPDPQLSTYDIAHHAGLSLEQEYEFMGLFSELQRQEYLKRHLRKVLPMLAGIEQLKQRVKLNGHFRNLSSLDLNIDSL